jgi:UDP-GlcNAc3NAcA epimerase
MKILTVVGARPQFIKAASLSREIAKREALTEVILNTNQHYDDNMAGVFFSQLEIPAPKYNLGINGLSHGAMTGRMIEGAEEVIFAEKPDG